MVHVHRHAFRAMGCHAQVLIAVDGSRDADRLVRLAERRIRHLERCWTRFDESSDVSAIDRAEGRAVEVDPSTIDLVRAMVHAWRLTGGLCQPAHRSDPGLDATAIDRTEIDTERCLVRVEPGVRLDAGSVGKGLAADLVSRQLMESGATGALVEIGGDLRATGQGPHHGFWSIGVDDPFGHEERSGRILVQDAGVSTSGLEVVERPGGPDNVSVDPRSGRILDPSLERVISATVIAGTAHEAEAWSTGILVDSDRAWSAALRRGCLARNVTRDGDVEASADWNRIFVMNEVSHV
jgi:thiamine biosynthesis lipoprotein